MPKKMEILLASRAREAIDKVAAGLRESGSYKVETRHINNGHCDPLHEVSSIPDVVVMLLNENGHSDLLGLIGEQQPGGPPMVVMAANGDAETMRLAMRAGARDFLSGVVTIDDLIESIDRVAAQHVDGSAAAEEGELTIFVNAKGGSGATFLACNAAHILTSVSGKSTALMSLDLQFGGLSEYFDIELRHGLMEVLDSVGSLDEVALDAYMTQHDSGLRILAAEPQDIIQCHSDKAEQLGLLVRKTLAHYDHVVVDMPRRVDPYMVPVLEKATRVVLVAQQTLGHLHDASRMLQIFEVHNIAPSQVLVVVNRYDKNAPISIDDVKRALRGTSVSLVPSDFKTVAESINLGIPMHEHARGSNVTKALLSLGGQIDGRSREASKGLFGRILRKDKWSHV